MGWRAGVGIVCALALTACSGSGSSAEKAKTIVGTPTSASGPSSVAPTTFGAPSSLDPCALLRAHDASRVAGVTLTRSAADSPNSGGCSYASADAKTSVEIFTKVDPDAAYAQADYPSWVQSVLDAPGFTVTPVSNFADGATEIRSSVFDAILFRKDTVLVKIGVTPKASHTELVRAATTVLGRL